ncbi:MAG: aminoacyl-tRNA hydrolase [Pseudonocardiales bacterium]|nr:MAG: aminoacyl-tRNA hydrolase [Pseudonocardiales bacterium]
MAEDLPLTSTVTIAGAELRERFSRSSGPGGQSVNTSDSRVELSFDLAGSPSIPGWLRERMRERLAGRLVGGVLTVVAAEHRSQLANRAAARDRLAGVLAAAAAPPPPPRRPTRPSRTAKERRLTTKRHRGEIKRGRSGGRDSE